jgi:hypothetical protein
MEVLSHPVPGSRNRPHPPVGTRPGPAPGAGASGRFSPGRPPELAVGTLARGRPATVGGPQGVSTAAPFPVGGIRVSRGRRSARGGRFAGRLLPVAIAFGLVLSGVLASAAALSGGGANAAAAPGASAGLTDVERSSSSSNGTPASSPATLLSNPSPIRVVPAPAPALGPSGSRSVPRSPHPGTLDVYEVAPGGATTEDPAVAYDTVSAEPILNVLEPLITYNQSTGSSQGPVLATCVPGTPECQTDYGSSLIDDQAGAPYTGAPGQLPVYWTFVLDPQAQFYDPTTGHSWGVYPTDVMFSEARELAWSELVGVGSTPGWLTAQALLPNGTVNGHDRAWDGGLHTPYNTTPGDILSSMLINDTAYCPGVAMTQGHGCITFRADGQGSDWPMFLELIGDASAGSVIPCGWYSAAAQGAAIPGWSGSHATAGDGPCAVPQLGVSQSTSSAAWGSYLTNLTSPINPNPSTNATSWDSYEEAIENYPAPNPHVQWKMVGSGPYYADLDPAGHPPGYTLHANPDYSPPVGCSGAGGLATYGPTCYPNAHEFIPTVDVVYEESDGPGLRAYRNGTADFAAIYPSDTSELINLASENKLNYYVTPTNALNFFALDLNWSSSAYRADDLPGQPNLPHSFFSGEAAREFLAQSYPYDGAEATAWTIDGVQYLSNTGGPIPPTFDGFYPSNVSYPSGNPNTDPSDVGGAAWWWAQGIDPSSPFYDPGLAACLTTNCTFPINGQEGDPGLDTAISEWITEIESLSSNHIVPYTFDLCFGCISSVDDSQLLSGPGDGPLTVWSLAWASDDFDPQDMMVPLEFPNQTFTYPDAVEQQLTGTQFDNTVACGHSLPSSFANLVYWSHQLELTSACEGVAWNVANWWNEAATHVANVAQRELDYDLVVHILNAESLYVWYGVPNQIITTAPWIAGASVNLNPLVGGMGDQPWFDIHYATADEPVTFSESGLPSGSAWTVSTGAPVTTKTNVTVGSSGRLLFAAPNGTLLFSIVAPAGYGVARVTGSGRPTFDSATISGPAHFKAHFGRLSTLYFNETIREPHWPGLPSGSNWSVELTALDTGERPISPSSNTTFGGTGSIGFTLPRGALYRFEVVPPSSPDSSYKASPGTGRVDMPGADRSKEIRFAPIASRGSPSEGEQLLSSNGGGPTRTLSFETPPQERSRAG